MSRSLVWQFGYQETMAVANFSPLSIKLAEALLVAVLVYFICEDDWKKHSSKDSPPPPPLLKQAKF